MTVLLVHEFYRQAGGEDVVFETDARVLESLGERVVRFTRHNDAIHSMTGLETAARAVWNPAVGRELADLVRRERPRVVHFHNTFPLISPAAYRAVREAGAPVVQTLHNFRLLCVGALLHRQGRPCRECVGRTVFWPGVLHRCYRGSAAASAAVALMLAVHRLAGTWRNQVDLYLALSGFARDLFVEGGLPAERIAVRPNFVPEDPGPGAHDGGYALFAGRLAPEKGVPTLLDAWRSLARPFPLRLAGTGPEEERLRSGTSPGVTWLGGLSRAETFEQMKQAAFLVMPSNNYEAWPLVIVEAMATGLPAVASRLGVMPELVQDGQTGLLFEPGDWRDLAAKVGWAVEHPEELGVMGERARQVYLERYGPARAAASLLEAYERAASGVRQQAR